MGTDLMHRSLVQTPAPYDRGQPGISAFVFWFFVFQEFERKFGNVIELWSAIGKTVDVRENLFAESFRITVRMFIGAS